MSIPYTSYSQLPLFTASTVHSYSTHNEPHQHLMDNDNNLQTQINALSSQIGNLAGYSIINVSHLSASPSNYSGPPNGSTSTFGIYPKQQANSNLLICWQGVLINETHFANSFFYFGFYPVVDNVILNGGPVYTACGGDAYETVSAYVSPWRYVTGLAAGNRNIQVQWYYVAGAGQWAGQYFFNASYLVVELAPVV